MLEAPKVPAAAAAASADTSLVVFCVDISGSMCVTSEVDGNISLKGDRYGGSFIIIVIVTVAFSSPQTQIIFSSSELQKLNTEGSSQRLPNQRRNVTYVSRLQAVQAAVDAQLQTLAKSSPQRRVAVIAFNGDVTVLGDGTQGTLFISFILFCWFLPHFFFTYQHLLLSLAIVSPSMMNCLLLVQAAQTSLLNQSQRLASRSLPRSLPSRRPVPLHLVQQ